MPPKEIRLERITIGVLVAEQSRVMSRNPGPKHPYGHHRAIGVAHLVAATALLIMGGFLIYSSATSLINVEKPPTGMIVLFGQDVWMGWLAVTGMALPGIAPVILGRMKLKLAPQLHDKVLYADADMNKADWSTALATIIGVPGMGMGV